MSVDGARLCSFHNTLTWWEQLVLMHAILDVIYTLVVLMLCAREPRGPIPTARTVKGGEHE